MKKIYFNCLLVALFFLAFIQNLQAQSTTFIPYGSVWRYSDNGSDQGTAWSASTYNDATWLANAGALGYAATGLTTTVSFGANDVAKYITTYFRKKITIADINNFANFSGNIKRDDGAVVYLNGVEVYRTNMPTGTITYTTLASGAASGNGSTPVAFTIPATAFVTGDNFIAVEIHQTALNSSDIFFDLELKGNYKPTGTAPYLTTFLPANLAKNIAVNSNIVLTFDKAITKGTGNIILKNGGVVAQTIDVNSAAVTISGSAVTLDPPLDFPANGLINLEMPTGVFLATADSKPTEAIVDTKTYTFGVTSQSTDPLTFIPYNATWKYLDNGSDQTTLWRTSTYSDLNWAGGPGPLGYDFSGLGTTVSFGPSGTSKYITTYFRKTISIDNPSQYAQVLGKIIKDDGAVVYINGTEVYRGTMPSGSIGYTTVASSSSGSNTTVNNFTIDPALLIDGLNVIAVEIHQSSGSSSDIFFNLELTGSKIPPPLAITRGPYLQMGGQNSLTLRWRTNNLTDSKVQYGVTAGNLTSTVTDPLLTKEHVVNITGLTADTKYFYNIGSTSEILQGAADNYFRTAPLATTTRKLRIAAFGDCGNNSANQVNTKNALLSYLGAESPDAWLLLGDNAYENGLEEEYQTKFFDVYKNDILKNTLLYPSPGNHDYANSGSRQDDHNIPYLSNFTMPTNGELGGVASGKKEYYSFDFGNIHFIALDAYGQEDNKRFYDVGSTQAAWLVNDLAANQKKWTVAFFHHPPYTMGSHDSDAEGDLVAIRQKLNTVLENNGVDLVVNGHSHVYERSLLLKNNYGLSTTYNAANHAVSTSSGRYDGSANSGPYITTATKEQHGTIYVVAGSSGKVGGAETGYPLSFMQYSNNTQGGSFEFEVEGNRLDAKFIAATGAILDQFTIMKDVNKTSTVTVGKGQSVTLDASWIGNHAWSTGETTKSITFTAPTTVGDYAYTVKDNAVEANKYLQDNFTVKVVESLPVKLTAFTANKVNSGIKLIWQTTSEQNASHFNLTRSANGQIFDFIGKVNASGNSNTLKNYTYTDYKPLSGANYYQLEQQDLDGKREKSVVVSANFEFKTTTLNVNSINENGLGLSVYSPKATNAKILLTNASGQKIAEMSVKLASGNNEMAVATRIIRGLTIILLTTENEKLVKKVVY